MIDRAEAEAALAEFLAKGGKIVRIETVVEPDRTLTAQPADHAIDLVAFPTEPEPSADD